MLSSYMYTLHYIALSVLDMHIILYFLATVTGSNLSFLYNNSKILYINNYVLSTGFETLHFDGVGHCVYFFSRINKQLLYS